MSLTDAARDPVDLLVYGTGDLALLSWTWRSALVGATLELPEGFFLARHAGRLTVKLTPGEGTGPAVIAAGRLAGDDEGGPLEGAFELFLEQLSAVDNGVGGLEAVPEEEARRIRRATFCAVLSLWATATAADCQIAVVAAAALARAAEGVVADLEEERYWLADALLADADRYLTEVLQIDRR